MFPVAAHTILGFPKMKDIIDETPETCSAKNKYPDL